MSVYNGERYLNEAVRSILGQTCEDFEFLIVDDGSTDKSMAILELLRREDRRIHVFHQENAGPAAARNLGFRQARGEYVAVMDADDVADPTRLEKQAVYLDAHPECLAVGCRLRFIDPDGELIAEEQERATAHEEIERVMFRGLGGIPNPGAMIRRSILQELNGYREDFPSSEDLDLWLRIGERGKLANLPEILLSYRLHPNSLGTRKHGILNEMAERAVREAYGRRGLAEPVPLGLNLTPPRRVDEIYLNWAWMGALSGRMDLARKHAWRGVREAPWRVHNWYVWLRISLGLVRSLRFARE